MCIKHKRLLLIGIILTVIFVLFSPVIKYDFVNWDDTSHFTEHDSIRSLSIVNIKEMFTETVLNVYIPLTSLSYAVEYYFFGPNPRIIHFTNLILHLITTGLLFLFILQLGINLRSAAIAALLFGIHPMHVESVAWITERKDVLYAVFYMSGLCSYGQYIKSGCKKFYLWTLILAFFSILAKSMALSFPLILFLCDWIYKRKFNRQTILEKLPFFIVFIPITLKTYLLHPRIPHIIFPDSLLIGFWTLTFYVSKFLFPMDLLPVYQQPQPISFYNIHYIFPFFLLIVWLIFIKKGGRWAVFASLFYLLSIFFLILYDIGSDINFLADRFMYLPCIGFCIFIGYAVDRAWIGSTQNNKTIRSAVIISLFVMVMSILIVKTHNQLKIWRNSESLWNYMIRNNPENPKFYISRAGYYASQGKSDSALSDLDQAAKIDPEYLSKIHNNKGTMYFQQGQYQLAYDHLSTALNIGPADALIYKNIGLVFREQNDYVKAGEYFTEAINIEPDNEEFYLHRGILHRLNKHYAQAIDDLNISIKIKSFNAAAFYERGLAHLESRNLSTALMDFNKTLTFNSRNITAYFWRAHIYLRINEMDLALRDYNKIILLDSKQGAAYHNRFLIYAAKEKYTQAWQNAQKGLSLGEKIDQQMINFVKSNLK